jgi:alpha-tubulin suppressor-like RCC1 family protein
LLSAIKNLGGVKAIASGGHHVLALKFNGSVVAWGNNANGQLGDGTTETRNTPVEVKFPYTLLIRWQISYFICRNCA